MTHCHELRSPVKLTDSWASNVYSPRNFYFYAYDKAARVISDFGTDGSRLTELSRDILQVAEHDGSLVDFEAICKNYGTAMALHVLYMQGDLLELGSSCQFEITRETHPEEVSSKCLYELQSSLFYCSSSQQL